MKEGVGRDRKNDELINYIRIKLTWKWFRGRNP
jgi:hypothetical protein